MSLLNLFLFSIPFWAPAAIGSFLLINKPNELSLMAGLLTLKPILTTAIWFAFISTLDSPVEKLEPAHFLSIFPGAGLTLIIAFAFRRLLSGPQAGSARTLVALDCVRWLDSFLIYLPYGGFSVETGSLVCIFTILGLALPTVFAVVALAISLPGFGEQVER